MPLSPPSDSSDWPVADLLAAKRTGRHRIAVVIPARNEEATVGAVVAQVKQALVDDQPLVDELVVMDSLSDDRTGAVAAQAGATVHRVADVRADLGVQKGKGEALWKSLFVTTADVLVFIDADLLDWGVHFVTGLLGPLLAEPETLLVKGFYDRVLDDSSSPTADQRPQGGRVTELVARPLISLRWPELAEVVQPLAGEWAIRRRLFERLPVPIGYGIELATLIDTWTGFGAEAIAQVDLGVRRHRHQAVHDLGVMATEIIAVADRRAELDYADGLEQIPLRQYDRTAAGHWVARSVPVAERPAAVTVAGYPSARAT
jgi:glucosyl-3-phosphoglycerate synthase